MKFEKHSSFGQVTSALVRNQMCTCLRLIKLICAIIICSSIGRVSCDSHLSDKAKIAFRTIGHPFPRPLARHKDGIGCLNPFSKKKRNSLSYTTNVISGDDLATQGARTSAAMLPWYWSNSLRISKAPEVFPHLIFPQLRELRRHPASSSCSITTASPWQIGIQMGDSWNQSTRFTSHPGNNGVIITIGLIDR